MADYTEVNKWTAEECGVTIDHMVDYWYWYIKGDSDEEHEDRWSIEHADCREIIRERFRITSVCDEVYGMSDDKYKWECESCKQLSTHIHCVTGKGQTETEAFKACIIIIYERERKMADALRSLAKVTFEHDKTGKPE